MMMMMMWKCMHNSYKSYTHTFVRSYVHSAPFVLNFIIVISTNMILKCRLKVFSFWNDEEIPVSLLPDGNTFCTQSQHSYIYLRPHLLHIHINYIAFWAVEIQTNFLRYGVIFHKFLLQLKLQKIIQMYKWMGALYLYEIISLKMLFMFFGS